MKLAELIRGEMSCALDQIALLRHSNVNVASLRRHGSTVEEYTALQPKLSKYDFWHPDKPSIRFVGVVVDDSVYGVFEVLGWSREGSSREISSPEYARFDAQNPERDCRLFTLQLVPSVAVNQPVHGWNGRTRTPVQRLGDGFFDEITVNVTRPVLMRDAVEEHFQAAIKKSLRSTAQERQRRLAKADGVSKRRQVVSTQYERNPDVVAEVLLRAAGACEICKRPAPFNRRSDGTPYLEVHHRLQLAMGGKDTVANAVAACPNCHRAAHFGSHAVDL